MKIDSRVSKKVKAMQIARFSLAEPAATELTMSGKNSGAGAGDFRLKIGQI